MHFAFILTVIIVFCIVMYVKSANSPTHYSRSYERDVIDKSESIADVGTLTNSAKIAQRKADEMQTYIYLHEDHMSEEGVRQLKRSLSEIKQNRRDILEYRHSEKMDAVLSKFHYYYECIVTTDEVTMRNAQDLISTKKKCLNSLRKYWEVSCTGENPINAKDYLRDYMGELFIPEMFHLEDLEKVLDGKLKSASSEVYRKRKSMRKIVDTVYEQESIMRSELCRMKFDGISENEMKYCVKELVSSGKLAEYKLADRWFVTVSDAEKERRQKKEAEKQAKEAEKQTEEAEKQGQASEE